jgi:acyl-CoA synthetase (NDP forming)
MSKESIASMAAKLPPNASLYNPVDVIGDATTDRYAAVLEAAAGDPYVDGILVILTPQAMTDAGGTAEAVIRTARSTDKPVITSFMGEARVREAIDMLKHASIPNFSYPELAVKAFKRLSDHRAWKDLPDEEPLRFEADSATARRNIKALTDFGKYQAGEDDAAAILSGYGFRFPRKMLTRTAKEAATAAAEIGYPVVMKIASPYILHKTDVGGVRLGVRNSREAEDAFLEVTTNAQRHLPQATILGVLVSEMVRGGREVILGVTYDRTFGHLLMFGLGGIYVEVLKDVAFRVAPLTRRDAEAMLAEVHTSALLRGARGEKAVDVEAVIDAIQRLSCLVTDVPEIRELDINPLVVLERGAVALDARIIFDRPAGAV